MFSVSLQSPFQLNCSCKHQKWLINVRKKKVAHKIVLNTFLSYVCWSSIEYYVECCMNTFVSGGCCSSIILAKEGVNNLQVLQVRTQTRDQDHHQKQKRHLFWKEIKTIFPAGIFSQGFEFNGLRHFLKTVQNKERALLSGKGIVLEIS